VPAKSKQQQKFFGVVKAMQSGNMPKKGAAGKAAKDMTKKEVDKYASTKHKGLPMKMKENISSKLNQIMQRSADVKDFIKKTLDNSNFELYKDKRLQDKFVDFLTNFYSEFNVATEGKKKGIDGKACWDGYRYAGTEDGKDKCVKVNEALGLEMWEHSQPVLWTEAEYQGRKVKLGQVTRTSGDKKFQVYVKNPKTDKVKKVTFGDGTGLSIKTKDPAKRKSFKARHKCDQKKDRTSAGYWSCRMWAGPDSVKNMLKKKK